MKTVVQLRTELAAGVYMDRLQWLYGCSSEAAAVHAEQYVQALDALEHTFGSHERAALFSAPGRTELGGNHTDHQHGRVLAASVDLDMIAAVSYNELGRIRLKSVGYDTVEILLSELEVVEAEKNTTAALIRGMCAAFAARGIRLPGLDICVDSRVPAGSGLSSSAAFEVLLGTVFSRISPDPLLDPVEIAKICQWVENVYFGKPCGLMDQMACSVGGAVSIDFAKPDHPVVTPVELNLSKAGYCLCILDSGADHADLTEEYAAVPAECKAVANACGGQVLREVSYEDFLAKLPLCRNLCSDRAVLRAIHFYGDNARVEQQTAALVSGDYSTYLRLVNESGHSSWEYLQNISPAGAVRQQAVAVTIAAAKACLRGKGAVRVHGGGFAGTVQAYVPLDMVEDFVCNMNQILGREACRMMTVRPVGGIRLA